jgi:hypothetical protein
VDLKLKKEKVILFGYLFPIVFFVDVPHPTHPGVVNVTNAVQRLKYNIGVFRLECMLNPSHGGSSGGPTGGPSICSSPPWVCYFQHVILVD